METRHSRTLRAASAFVTAVVLGLGCGAAGAKPDKDGRDLEIRTLSNDANRISGGDALVEIVLPHGTDTSNVRVELNQRDITYQFATRENGRFLGLVNQLKLGKNKLSAKVAGKPAEKLTITNHPIGGPIFSGPQVQPWLCETVAAGLGPAKDAQCNAPTNVGFFYRSTNAATPGFLPYDQANPPTDVATTKTDRAVTVPYIVRVESGTLNRSIYTFAVLADPSQAVAPWLSPRAWNHKLYYLFSGGAEPKHDQGQPTSVFDDLALSRGFAVATTSRDILQNNSNTVTSAESVMMLKEHIVETLGEIRYTMSMGASGASILQNLIANAYPGLLNGIQPFATLADLWTTNTEAQDCSLLLRYFTSTAPRLWPDVVLQNAVMDNANELPGTCRAMTSPPYSVDIGWMNPTSTSCLANVVGGGGPNPQPWMYDPVTNPTGARCTLQDYQVAIFGKRRQDGFANRPYDNVGVQYGLKALQARKITPEQFVDMNEKVGGRDIDWHWTPQRSVADPFALEAAYRSGQVNLGGGMATVADVDIGACAPNYPSPTVNSSLHSCFHTPELVARLVKTNGHADNHVLLQDAPPQGATPDVTGDLNGDRVSSFDLLDRWLAAVEADTSRKPLAVKVVRDKPADAVDACWIYGQKVVDPAVCAAAFPSYGDPHIGAGALIDDDVLKCQLKPLRRSDYAVSFTSAQWARLQSAFRSGVCDWTKVSVGYTPAVPWLSFDKEPGGRPLEAAPVSKPDDGHDERD